MTTFHWPRVITDMICEFAYNVPCKKNMFLDLDWQLDVQKNIPMFFFTMSVPTTPCFPHDSPLIGGRITEGGGYYQELYTPNPFRKGNPYYPTTAINHYARIFSQIANTCTALLRNDVVRKHRMYKSPIERKVACYLRLGIAGVERWNHALTTIFNHPFWYYEKSYDPTTPMEAHLIRLWVRELRKGAFVQPCASPF